MDQQKAQLQVEIHRWRRILHQINDQLGTVPRDLQDNQIHELIASLIVRGNIKVYPVTHLTHNGQSVTYLAIPAGEGMQYRFVPASMLLVKSQDGVRIFRDKGAAEKFVQSLNLNDAAIESIINAHAPRAADGAARSSVQTTAMLIEMLANGEVVVAKEMISAAPPKPAAVEIIKAGICATRPSPMASRV